MRRLSLALSVSVLLAFASPVLAAPTCQDRTGVPTRCGTPNAMPVGWVLPTGLRVDRDSGDEPVSRILLSLLLVGGLLGLIAAMPDFDGWGDVDANAKEDG